MIINNERGPFKRSSFLCHVMWLQKLVLSVFIFVLRRYCYARRIIDHFEKDIVLKQKKTSLDVF